MSEGRDEIFGSTSAEVESNRKDAEKELVEVGKESGVCRKAEERER